MAYRSDPSLSKRLPCRVDDCPRLGTLRRDLCEKHHARIQRTGTTDTRVNESASHCNHGHLWPKVSTGRYKNGARHCKTCDSDRANTYQKSHRAKVNAYKKKWRAARRLTERVA